MGGLACGKLSLEEQIGWSDLMERARPDTQASNPSHLRRCTLLLNLSECPLTAFNKLVIYPCSVVTC